jgi:membrane-bound serine protease (ClpP class)
LLIGELHTGSGLLLLGAIAVMISALVMMFKQGFLFNPVNWWLVSLLIVIFTALIIFSLWRIIKTYRQQPATGKEDLKGKPATVKQTLDPEGMVMCQGELWNAISTSGRIDSGETVIIEKVEGLTLYVVRKPRS